MRAFSLICFHFRMCVCVLKLNGGNVKLRVQALAVEKVCYSERTPKRTRGLGRRGNDFWRLEEHKPKGPRKRVLLAASANMERDSNHRHNKHQWFMDYKLPLRQGSKKGEREQSGRRKN